MIPLYSDDDADTNYPAIRCCILAALAELHLPALPQDCVVLCGAGIAPGRVGEHLGTGAGAVQVFHGGVEYFDNLGDTKYLPTSQVEGQEEVGRRWSDGEGGCLVTHNPLFSGCEAATAILISKGALEPGVRSGLLRGVARLVMVGGTGGVLGYKKEKMMDKFTVIEM